MLYVIPNAWIWNELFGFFFKLTSIDMHINDMNILTLSVSNKKKTI